MDVMDRPRLTAFRLRRRIDPCLQSEAAECGLACLAMVLGWHGHHTSLIELRRRFPLSLRGATLAQLMDFARASGLSSRPLRLELEELGQLRLPCILHWELNHFVVLGRVDARGIEIHDPAVGKRRISFKEASEKFTGVALELSPAIDFKRQETKPSVPFRRLLGHVLGLKRALLQILLLSLALQVFGLLAPLLTQGVMDHVLVTGDRDLLVLLVFGFAALMLIQVLVGVFRSWATLYLSSHLGLQWMGNVLAHLVRLPVGFFEKRHLGDITSRLGSVGVIQNTLTSTAIGAVLDGLMAVTTLLVMLRYSPMLALVSMAALLVYLCIRLATYRIFRQANEEQLVRAAKQQSHLLETLRGAQSIKLAGCETQRHSAWQALAVATQNQAIRIARMGIAYGSLNQLVFGVERILVIYLAALLVLGNQFSIGMLVAYLAYKEQFSGRVGSLIDLFIELRMLRLHGERLGDIVLAEPEADEPASALAPAPASLDIGARGLGFRYAETEPWVFRGLDLDIAEGESVAIVGPSGMGKTSLLKVLLGLLPPSEGEVSVGGVPVSRLGHARFRGLVAAVMQDDQLFAGSLMENIAFGEEAPDHARVEAAARQAGLHDDVMAMPMGYLSLIGDMGSALSGGQKQRLVLARALYRQPRILFLDEATSHLDLDRERSVNAAIGALNITRIIVAHRPETIASADRVLELTPEGLRERPRAADAPAADAAEALPA